MTSKKIIAITGSIASGKSTVVDYIKKRGFYVIDSDKIAHKLMNIGEKNYENIKNYFYTKLGFKNILDENGNIDRKELAKLVFNDKNHLDSLNKLTHPNIFNMIIDNINDTNENIIFVDIPLLYEIIEKEEIVINFDEVWLIYVKPEIQLERLINRNKLSKEEALKRISSQISIDEKIKFNNVVIDNSYDINHLYNKIERKIKNL